MELYEDENRWSSRIASEYDVIISSENIQPIKGKMLDYSFSGIFVSTDTEAPPVETPVDLRIQIGDNNNKKVHHVAATISRTTSRGAGIKFNEYDEDTIETLSNIYCSR